MVHDLYGAIKYEELGEARDNSEVQINQYGGTSYPQSA
jgi:hypothetical protein